MCILLLLLSESVDRANQNISFMLYMTHLKCPCGDFEWICLKPLHLCSNFSTWSSSPCLVRHSVHFCREQRRRRPVKNFLLPKFTTTQIIAPMAIFRMPSGFAFSRFFSSYHSLMLFALLCVCLHTLIVLWNISLSWNVIAFYMQFLTFCALSLSSSLTSFIVVAKLYRRTLERAREIQ